MTLPAALDPLRRQWQQQVNAATFHAAEALAATDDEQAWRHANAQARLHLAIADTVTQWVAATEVEESAAS